MAQHRYDRRRWLQDGVPNRSPDEGTVASNRVGNQRHRNKQNLDYALRTGVAGGFAGCAVCTLLSATEVRINVARRPKHSLDPSIVSKSYSKRPTLSLPNIPVLGSVS